MESTRGALTRRKDRQPRHLMAVPNAAPLASVDLLEHHADGIHVTLYWSRSSGRTWVEAVSRDTDERLYLETGPAKVLDVFYDSSAHFFPAEA